MLPAWLVVSRIIFGVMLVAVGASIASFWALVAYRVPKNMAWWAGRSECDFCRRKIGWWENIPVVYFAVLRGKCRYCHRHIDWLYWTWEILLGLWTLGWFWWSCPVAKLFDPTDLAIGLLPFWEAVGGVWPLVSSLLWWALGAVLIWIALVDWRTQTVATGWLWVVGVLGVAYLAGQLATGTLTVWQVAGRVISGMVVALTFVLINQVSRWWLKRPGIGSGDMWLVLMLAWWLPIKSLVVMFLLQFWLGAAVGLLVVCWARRYRVSIAFLPFITSAFLASFYLGEPIFEALFGA